MTDWASIVREFGPLVYRTAIQLLNHEADAADCFQKTFVSAVCLDSREPIRNWSAILVRLATSRALEQLRSRYRRSKSFEPLVEEPADFEDPTDRLVSNELSEHLRLALSEIDQRQAEVFCLVSIEELSNVEAAEILGINSGHVAVLLQRARAALRKRMKMFDPAREE
jgi:RNA polymerase sigma-70 factor (ECF subfamily)